MKNNLTLLAAMLVMTSSSTAFACGGSSGYSSFGYRPAISLPTAYVATHHTVTIQPVGTSSVRVGNFNRLGANATALVQVSSLATVATSPTLVAASNILTPARRTQATPPVSAANPEPTDNRPSTAAESSTSNSRLQEFFSGLSTQELLKLSA